MIMKFKSVLAILFFSLLAMTTTSQAQSALDNKYFAQQLEIDNKKRAKRAEKKRKREAAAAAAAAATPAPVTAAPVAKPAQAVNQATNNVPAMMGDCKQIQAHYKKMCMTKGDMVRWIK